MTLEVKTVRQDISFTLEVDDSFTIEGVKKKIHRGKGYPTNQQQLIYNSKQVYDSCTLKDYDFQKQARIIIILKLQGIL